jgi:Aldo/keto reductase family
MRYKLFGGAGLRVSELCLGTMAFGEDWGWGASKQECSRIVGAFAEAGGNFIDTADVYTNGSSERFIGELLDADRDRFVLATKYTCARDPRDPNAAGNHRKNLVAALDGSLERLGTDYVDVLYVHIWDFLTPVAWPPEFDALSAAPDSHRLLLENDHVRVLQIAIEPGGREPEHTHRWPSVMIIDQPARIRYYENAVKTESPPRSNSETRLCVTWMDPEGPHAVENIDTKPYHALRIEMKDDR